MTDESKCYTFYALVITVVSEARVINNVQFSEFDERNNRPSNKYKKNSSKQFSEILNYYYIAD